MNITLCIKKSPGPGCGIPGCAGGAPAYLSIPGFELCLEEVQHPGDSHTEKCIPANKPEYCSQQAWEDLQASDPKTSPQKCPGNYMDVPGYEDCIKETGSIAPDSGICLPVWYKPETCQENAWNLLHENLFQ